VKNPYRIGEKVYLRPLEREDAPSIVRWLNDLEVSRTLLFHRPINVQAEEKFLEGLYAKDDGLVLLGIALRQDDRLIGAADLRDFDARGRHAGFGIMIGEKVEQGKGRGTEATRLMVKLAFDTYNLNRVWLHVHADNERGIRAYERVGFKREGVLRQHAFREGKHVDELVMGVLRGEEL
jgi:ribosomal-protein-alanine N-acetyltransferase